MERGRKGGEDGGGRMRRGEEEEIRRRVRRDTYWRKCVQLTGT